MNKRNIFLRALLSTVLIIVVSMTSNSAAKLSVPSISESYTVKKLTDLIRTNESGAHFIIALDGGIPITHDKNNSGIDGAGSAVKAGLDNAWIEANAGMIVTLYKDIDLVNLLVGQKRLLSGDVEKYSTILLYFIVDINGKKYRVYLEDPFPGVIRIIRSTRIYPAGDNITNWAI